MIHLTSEEVVSGALVVACLEREAARLPRSSTLAAVWRDWAGLLTPTLAEQTQPSEKPPLSSPRANAEKPRSSSVHE